MSVVGSVLLVERGLQEHDAASREWVVASGNGGATGLVPRFVCSPSSTIKRLEWGALVVVLGRKKPTLLINKDTGGNESGCEDPKRW